MIIVLDTTAIVSDPLCSGLAWKILAHARNVWGVRCVISDVSVVESIAGYRRRLREAKVGLDRWEPKHAALGLEVQASAIREAIDTLSGEYPDRLDQTLRDAGVEVLQVPDVPHLTLVERAAQRIKPCDANGDGYRDTLNWFLILALAKSDTSEDLVWVSGNTKDFTDTEESGLHQELLEELRDVGASEVTWLPTLGEAVLWIAEKYNPDVQNLGDLHRRVQEEALHTFLDGIVLPQLVEQSVSPRRCALPLGSKTALIAAVGEVTTLEWTPRVAVEADQTVIEFSVRAEVVLLITMDARLAAEDPTLTIVVVEPDEVTVQVVKTLVMRGLLTLDKWDRPQQGEVTRVEALVDDPRRSEWLAHDAARTVLDTLAAGWRPLIPADMIKSILPVIPPELLKPVLPVIPPDLLKSILPIFPSELLKSMLADLVKGMGGLAPPEGPARSKSQSEKPPPSPKTPDESAQPPAGRGESGDSDSTNHQDQPTTTSRSGRS